VGASDLVDPFGRVIRDLRISVTDRCNFRCTYCMPDRELDYGPRDELLSLEEVEQVCAAFVRRGGHVGFVAGQPWRRRYWAETRAACFLAERLVVSRLALQGA